MDDLRYLCKLEALIRQARLTGRAQAQRIAAEQLLQKIHNSIIPNWTAYTQGGMKWPASSMRWIDHSLVTRYGLYQAVRRMLVNPILALQQALQ